MLPNEFAVKALHDALSSADANCVTVETFTLQRYNRLEVHGYFDPQETGDIWALLVLMLGSRFKVESVHTVPDKDLDGWREYHAVLKVHGK